MTKCNTCKRKNHFKKCPECGGHIYTLKHHLITTAVICGSMLAASLLTAFLIFYKFAKEASIGQI